MSKPTSTSLIDVVNTIVSEESAKDAAVQVSTDESGQRTISVLNSDSKVIASATLFTDAQLVDSDNKEVTDGVYAVNSKRFAKKSTSVTPPRAKETSTRSGAGCVAINPRNPF